MSEVVSKGTPPKDIAQQSGPDNVDLNRPLTSRSPYFYSSFGDAVRSLPTISPRGSIVVLLGVPDETRDQTLKELNSEIKNGKRIWSVKDALREVVTHSGEPFPAAEKFIINGYVPLRAGPNMELSFQMNVVVKCKQSPAFVLTNQWPDPTTLGKGLEQSPFNFRWAKGFFTPNVEVLSIRYDELSKTFEMGLGSLTQEGTLQRYNFSDLAPEIIAK
jgi:hypothetical protein